MQLQVDGAGTMTGANKAPVSLMHQQSMDFSYRFGFLEFMVPNT